VTEIILFFAPFLFKTILKTHVKSEVESLIKNENIVGFWLSVISSSAASGRTIAHNFASCFGEMDRYLIRVPKLRIGNSNLS